MSSGSAKAGKASAEAIIEQLRKLESPKDKEGMARYGIKTDKAFGVSLYVLRDMAKGIGTDHQLALALWDTGNARSATAGRNSRRSRAGHRGTDGPVGR